MDPLSTLSIVAAVVQFVDFGSRVLSGAKEAYSSSVGRTSQNAELSATVADLSTFSSELEAKSKLLINVPVGSSQEVFVRLSSECKDISRQLGDAISKHQVTGDHGFDRALSSLVVVIKGIWSAGEIERMKHRLGEIKEEIKMALLIFIWDEASKRGDSVAEFAQRQADMMRNLDLIDKTTRNFSQQFEEMLDKKAYKSREKSDYFISVIWDSKSLPDPTPPDTSKITDQQQVQKINTTIASSLLFDTIGARELAIPEAHIDTFKWIFSKPRVDDDGQPLWSDFPRWLESESKDVYWITGKPGAGKSTLIKHVLGQTSLRSHLDKWSGNLPLIVAGFYFWNAGINLQKTSEGLLRTLLYQILSAQPDLISQIHPRRWTLLQIFGSEVSLPRWTTAELVSCFDTLASKAGRNFNLALLIDGLDEYEGDHKQLVDLVQRMNLHEGVKICVSSRPWNIFDDRYRRGPMLKVENLTKEDIEAFVRVKFSQSDGFQELKAMFPSQVDKLLRDVVDKAQGVFLWVAIVVEFWLVDLIEGVRLSNLQATLDDIPDDVAKLFERIWNRIEPKFRAEASQYFQLIEAMRRQNHSTFLQTLWLADEEIPCEFDLNGVTTTAAKNALKNTKRRLNSRTKGLVEIYADDRVDYLHRTGRDWVLGSWETIRSKSSPEFDPDFALLKAITIQISAVADNTSAFISFDPEEFPNAISPVMAFAHATNAETSKLVMLLDRVNSAFTKISRQQEESVKYAFCRDFVAKTPKSSLAPHWIFIDCPGPFLALRSTSGGGFPDSCQGWWFLGFCSQVPISSYVKAKISSQSDVFIPKNALSSVLHGAIFGHQFSGFERRRGVIKYTREYDKERLELVEFILEKCRFSDASLVRMFHKVGSWKEKYPELLKYQAKVESLLERRLGLKTDQVGQSVHRASILQGTSEGKVGFKKRVRGMLKFDLKRHHQ
ncbi:hypothetical protein NM208_g9240 [Fusarium decemcellulare]|uniref:Uncharacterized protein n=1 Tax=Fusarium decemcellulare TaxID=57161 RepID=A0ACC1S2C7_9HYPO|nr:hypothetical protein NM208_g9240 [Fusarium decemcellulare]